MSAWIVIQFIFVVFVCLLFLEFGVWLIATGTIWFLFGAIFQGVTNVNRFFFLPTLYWGEELCERPECRETHHVLGMSWLRWSVEAIC